MDGGGEGPLDIVDGTYVHGVGSEVDWTCQVEGDVTYEDELLT
jgi:hypothetical protein